MHYMRHFFFLRNKVHVFSLVGRLIGKANWSRWLQSTGEIAGRYEELESWFMAWLISRFMALSWRWVLNLENAYQFSEWMRKTMIQQFINKMEGDDTSPFCFCRLQRESRCAELYNQNLEANGYRHSNKKAIQAQWSSIWLEEVFGEKRRINSLRKTIWRQSSVINDASRFDAFRGDKVISDRSLLSASMNFHLRTCEKGDHFSK